MMRGFRVPFDGRALVGDVLAGEESPRLLVLHGAGQSNREKFRQVREHFLAFGIGSVAFDCTGHGETGGDLKQSSLQSRTAQACAVIEALSLPQPFSVLAGSMGGYTAVTATPTLCDRQPHPGGPRYVRGRGVRGPVQRRVHRDHPVSEELGILGWLGAAVSIYRATASRGRRARHRDPPGVIQGIYESGQECQRAHSIRGPEASHMVLTDLRATPPTSSTASSA